LPKFEKVLWMGTLYPKLEKKSSFIPGLNLIIVVVLWLLLLLILL